MITLLSTQTTTKVIKFMNMECGWMYLLEAYTLEVKEKWRFGHI